MKDGKIYIHERLDVPEQVIINKIPWVIPDMETAYKMVDELNENDEKLQKY